MHRILVVLAVLLVVAAPVVEAKGKADAPGQQKKEPAILEPAPLAPVPSGPAAPAPPLPAAAPAPAPSSPAPARETASGATAPPASRIAQFDASTAAIPTLPPYASASVASMPLAAPGGVPSAWTWLLPVVGLVGAGATALAVRQARRPARVEIATAPRPTLRLAEASVPSLLRAGKAALERDHVDEAVAWFTQAVRLDPTLAVGHFARGVCLSSLGRYQEAYRAIKRAHLLDPLEGSYRFELARAGARIGRHAEAMSLLALLIDLLPELADVAAKDEAFRGLRDHPRFLAMTNQL